MTVGPSSNWFPNIVQTRELRKIRLVFGQSMALDLDLLGLYCLLDVLGGMLLLHTLINSSICASKL